MQSEAEMPEMDEPSDKKQLVLFGAGMTGRGQVAQLAYEDGWNLTLIDKDLQLVNLLRQAGEYTVQLLSEKPRKVTIRGFEIYHVDEIDAIYQAIGQAKLIVTSVLEPNLADVAKVLAQAIMARIDAGVRQPLNVIAAENMGDSTSRLLSYVRQHVPESLSQSLMNLVGFPNSMISRVVPLTNDPLHILTEEYSEWTADQHARIGEPPALAGLEWVTNQSARLYRKLYIHNTGHMICGSLGWLGNYRYIHEAAQNPDIQTHIKAAISESGEAVSWKYGFSQDDVKKYEEHLLSRLIISELPDDIRRVIRHPIRKLGKSERLIGPLQLCEKFNLPRAELCYGVAAVLAGSEIPYGFHDYDNQAENIRMILTKVDPIEALNELVDYQPLVSTSRLILDAYEGIRSKLVDHEINRES
jgi:mannitol-1-phosphate 5-dehydrogenase